MVSKIIKTIYILMTLTILGSFTLADFQTTTVTWVVPSAVSHGLSYGALCTGSQFYFVEHDPTINGTQTKILPHSQNTYQSDKNCQNSTDTVAITLDNSGNVTIDANMAFTSTLESGVTFKAWLGNSNNCGADGLGGYQDTCAKFGGDDSDVPTTSECVAIGDSNVQVIADLAAAGDADLCFAADFVGLSQGSVVDTLESSAWASEG